MPLRNFLTWGIHSVNAALQHVPNDALELWLKEGELSGDLNDIQKMSESIGVAPQIVPTKTLTRLSDGAVNQGVILRRRLPKPLPLESYIAQLAEQATPALLLILDHIQDPHNFGACLRVADGAGADAVIVTRDNCAPISGTVAKSASGALDTVPIISVTNLARTLDQLRAVGIWLIGADHNTQQTIYDCNMEIPTGLVLGSEAKGLRVLTRKKCDHFARIPMAGSVASLNVSTATAISLFEAQRQRLVAS